MGRLWTTGPPVDNLRAGEGCATPERICGLAGPVRSAPVASGAGRDQDEELEVLAAGVLADPPLVELDEPFDVPFDEPESPPEDDSDFAGLLGVLAAVSEPDERESVR
ncbi:hypothetical protein GA0070613_1147 [Micromonospora inositola]|uniref:Uncharacterized protein n=1 Tax=Micromonospora inositola TaxID=47865 RepID=A0A1C5HDD2_9ACTN|nr:hypothetical protein GA0070613_1147 [Micromonospora inositola]